MDYERWRRANTCLLGGWSEVEWSEGKGKVEWSGVREREGGVE